MLRRSSAMQARAMAELTAEVMCSSGTMRPGGQMYIEPELATSSPGLYHSSMPCQRLHRSRGLDRLSFLEACLVWRVKHLVTSLMHCGIHSEPRPKRWCRQELHLRCPGRRCWELAHQRSRSLDRLVSAPVVRHPRRSTCAWWILGSVQVSGHPFRLGLANVLIAARSRDCWDSRDSRVSQQCCRSVHIASHMHFDTKVMQASWSSDDKFWTIKSVSVLPEDKIVYRTKFYLSCCGYYDYD